jgi:bifunctional DNase/RNase
MIEVIVHDIALQAPVSEPAQWLACGSDYKLGPLRVILLKQRDGDRILPIWVGPGEGDVIGLYLERLAMPRPSTWDLTTALLSASGARIEKAVVTDLRENVYIASIVLNVNGQPVEVDARPSDAILLALQANAPLFVDDATFESNASLAASESLNKLDGPDKSTAAQGGVPPEASAMEWRSYRSLARAESSGWIPRQE